MADAPKTWDEDTTATDLAEHGDPPRPRRDRPCVTVLTGSEAGQVFRIARGGTTIGRAVDAAVRIADDGLSRHHARVRHDGDHIVIDDLASRNGTFVNGDRVSEPTRLGDGDKIQLGRTTVLRFSYYDEIDESFHDNLVSSALRDPMTRLYNKRFLLDRLDSELRFAQRHDTALSLLMIDIDHFKKLNDSHGHLAGDAVLGHLATTLIRAVRNEDVVARFGGEEFAIILRAIPIDPAAALGERLRRLIEHTASPYQDHQLRATVSIGVAGFPSTPSESVEQLIEAADQALYRAKRSGRNRVSR